MFPRLHVTSEKYKCPLDLLLLLLYTLLEFLFGLLKCGKTGADEAAFAPKTIMPNINVSS